MAERKQIALALGSNLGDRLDFLRKAVTGVTPFVQVEQISNVYETHPAYVTDQPAFLNAALSGTTTLEPLPLLYAVKNLEREIGRMPSFRYGPRAIDIDILFYGDQIIKSPELEIPHPRMTERDFVMRPLCDILPDWVHPQANKTACDILAGWQDQTIQNLGKVL